MSNTPTLSKDPVSYVEWPKNINKIMFIIVMELEAKHSIDLFNLKQVESTIGDPFLEAYSGEFAGKMIYIVKPPLDPVYNVQAVSTEPATLCLQTAIARFKPDIVISAGTSGGVKRQENSELHLRIKDIVVASSVEYFTRTMIIKEWGQYVNGRQYALLNPKPLQEVLSLKLAAIGTDNSFTNDNTAAIKGQIDCIEMEAAAEIRVCHLMKVPFTAIKIISDVEMEDHMEREALFQDFFTHGIKDLSFKLKDLVENIDKISNCQ